MSLDISETIGFGVSEALTDPVENGFVRVHGEDGEGVQQGPVTALTGVIQRCG